MADTHLARIAGMFSTGEVDDVVRVFTDDYVDHQRPEWMDLHGPEEFLAIVEGARSSLPDLRVRVVGDSIHHDQLEVAVMHWIGTTATGDLIDRYTVETIRIDEGRVAEHWGMEIGTSALRSEEGDLARGQVP